MGWFELLLTPLHPHHLQRLLYTGNDCKRPRYQRIEKDCVSFLFHLFDCRNYRKTVATCVCEKQWGAFCPDQSQFKCCRYSYPRYVKTDSIMEMVQREDVFYTVPLQRWSTSSIYPLLSFVSSEIILRLSESVLSLVFGNSLWVWRLCEVLCGAEEHNLETCQWATKCAARCMELMKPLWKGAVLQIHWNQDIWNFLCRYEIKRPLIS